MLAAQNHLKTTNAITALGVGQDDESDGNSSNMNSHRRCKSQNVKRDRNETNGSSIGKKSIDRKKQ